MKEMQNTVQKLNVRADKLEELEQQMIRFAQKLGIE
jgi:hypothetical protein